MRLDRLGQRERRLSGGVQPARLEQAGELGNDRLLAFLDAIIEVISRNKSLMAELAYSAAADPPAREPAAQKRDEHPVYRFWHGHISALIAAQRPGTDAEMIAHLMLSALHSEPILAQLATDGPERLTAAMRALASAVLDAPASTSGSAWLLAGPREA